MNDAARPTLANYRIVARLGAGGMGVVYRAEDRTLRREVALKFLTEASLGDPRLRLRFLHEARTAASLNHPNVCTVHQIGEIDDPAGVRLPHERTIRAGTPFIVMELIRGETLAERMRRLGALPLAELLAIAEQVADGLAEAHARGIVHRDLKPGNVMIAAGGRVKIVDFGLARRQPQIEGEGRTPSLAPTVSADLTRTGTFVGTPAYCSPEQLRARAVDPRSDLFCFGIMLYEMAAGRHPFEADSAAGVVGKILEREPTPLEEARAGLPREFVRLVHRCLRKDPDRRPAHALELGRILRGMRGVAAAAPDLAAAVPPPLLRRTGELMHGRPARLAVALVAAAVAIGSAAWWVRGVVKERAWPPLRDARIAVVPFTNTSPDPQESEYVSQGLSRALIDRLTSVGVRTVPWEDLRPFISGGESDRAIASRLQADVVIGGTFRMEHETIEARLALVAVDTGETYWSDEFREGDGALMQLGRRIAVAAGSAIKGGLTHEEQARLAADAAQDTEAYYSYLQGAYFLQQPGRDSIDAAQSYFEQAVRTDPTLADAHIGLGAVHSERAFRGWGAGEESLNMAEQSFSEAIRLRRDTLRARRGLVRVYYERGLSELVLEQAREALRLGSVDDLDSLLTRGEAFFMGGLPELAIPLLRRAIELDPSSKAAHWFEVLALVWNRQLEDGILAGERYTSRFGEDAEIETWVGVAHHVLGQYDEAARHYDAAIGLFGDSASLYMFEFAIVLYRRMGRKDDADRLCRQALDQARARLALDPGSGRSRAAEASFLALLGDREAFETAVAGIRRDVGGGQGLQAIGWAALYLGQVETGVADLNEGLALGTIPPPVALEARALDTPAFRAPAVEGFRASLAARRELLRRRFAPQED